MLTKEEIEIVARHCGSGPEDSTDDSVGVNKLYKHGLEANAEIEKLKAEVELLRNVKVKAIRLLNDWHPDPEQKYLDCWREELYDAIKLAENKKEEGG